MWKTLTEGHIKLFSSLFPDGFEPVPSSPLNTALRDNFARDITYIACKIITVILIYILIVKI